LGKSPHGLVPNALRESLEAHIMQLRQRKRRISKKENGNPEDLRLSW
jgi:hypothetical protein